MLYDLRAGKIIMNQAASIFTGDRSPETRSSTPQEQSILRDNPFPQISEERQPFSKSGNKFVKLASPEVSRYIYSQTAPKASPLQLQEAESGFVKLLQAIENEKNKIVSAAEKLPVVGDIIKFFNSLFNSIKTLFEKLKSGQINSSTIVQAFDPVFKFVMGSTNIQQSPINQQTPANVVNSNLDEEKLVKQNFPDAYKKPNGLWFIKRNGVEQQILVSQNRPRLAQRSPQQGTTYISEDPTKDLINSTIGVVITIGTSTSSGITSTITGSTTTGIIGEIIGGSTCGGMGIISILS
jgi:hypothetical protein